MARILVVDDSRVVRRNLVSILNHAGHTVVDEAADGDEACLMYQKHNPDLVTMDITMPKMDGVEAVRHIKADFPEARIIMVSAIDQKDMVIQALKAGARHYIIKPVNPEKVVSTINEVLAAKQPPVEEKAEAGNPFEEKPFVIRNEFGLFHVKLSKSLAVDSIKQLVQAVEGLLYVKPLKVLIDFETNEDFDDTLLHKIADVAKVIHLARGVVKVTAKKEKYVEMIKGKNIEFLSDIIEPDLHYIMD